MGKKKSDLRFVVFNNGCWKLSLLVDVQDTL